MAATTFDDLVALATCLIGLPPWLTTASSGSFEVIVMQV